jgi:flagellar protein FlaJ
VIGKDLKKTSINLSEVEYLCCSLVNVVFLMMLFAVLFWVLFFRLNYKGFILTTLFSIAGGIGLGMLFFVIYLRYPTIIAGKKGERIDKNLVFALKELYLQIISGVTLYDALANVANSNYGEVSEELQWSIKQIETGTSMQVTLEELAANTRSDYLKRTVWQLVNTMRAGGTIKGAIKTIIEDLVREQRGKIKDYAQELNLWCLMYMLFAVAIPTIGITMLVILSGFAGFNVTPVTFTLFIAMTFAIQIALIGLIKSRRPMVNI